MQIQRAFIVILAILLLISGVSARAPQGQDGVYFEDTGYWVRGDFLSFYRAAPNPERLFGNPISDAMDDPLRPGFQVQYFERARFDYDPVQPAGKRITLANLGQTLRDESSPGEPLDFSTNTNMCRQFSNDHLVCYAFLQFYDRYNGEVYFGQPVSDTEYLDGRLVQYFDRARLEWRTDRPVGERVVLTELGRIAYQIQVGRGQSITGGRLELTAQAFVASPVLAAGQKQQVFVVVYDQKGQPVPDASVILIAAYPDGHSESFRPQPTNADGFTQASFTTNTVEPNQVVTLTATAQLSNGPEATAQAWFRIWW